MMVSETRLETLEDEKLADSGYIWQIEHAKFTKKARFEREKSRKTLGFAA